MAAGKARFGRVRKLPSGRWQARYHGPDGMDRPAPVTFATVTDARIWLATVETDMLRGKWIDPTGGRVLLGDYAERWMANRPDLANRTREKYAGLIKLHIGPAFGRREMARVEPSAVRGWWAKLAQTHPTTAAGAYRLLNSIYRTAVADGIVARNLARSGAAASSTPPSDQWPTWPRSQRWLMPCPPASGGRAAGRVVRPSSGRAPGVAPP